MKFVFHKIAALPSLAWCAEIPAQGSRVRVLHGPGVETAKNWFVEGAWDGVFGTNDFISATTLAGSGASIGANGALEFAGPSNPYRGLVVHRMSNLLLISNSLPFLCVRAELQPDPGIWNYYRDLFRIFNLGFVNRMPPLKLAGDRQVRLLFHGNLRLQNRMSLFQKPSAAAPESYVDYRNRLVAMLERLKLNAADPRRQRTYLPMVSVSRGYDSVGCAALGVRVGIKEAFTFYNSEAGDSGHADDGSLVAKQLGLAVHSIDVNAWRKRIDVPEVDFLVTGDRGVMVRLAGLEDMLRQRLLLLGNLADRSWDVSSSGILPNWGRPRRPNQYTMGAESIWEFQLRAGFIAVYPAEFAAVHWDAMRRLMNSEEMRPWSVGGKYDRPLPRRLAEEMGVSREGFGQRKMATSHENPMKTPSVHGRADYLQFLGEFGSEPLRRAGMHPKTPLRFHWGMNRVMRRYRAALNGETFSTVPAS